MRREPLWRAPACALSVIDRLQLPSRPMRADRFRHRAAVSRHWRRLHAAFRHTAFRVASAIAIIFAVLVTVPVLVVAAVLYAENRQYRIYQMPNNSFYEVVIPPPFDRPESRDFKYASLLRARGCIERSAARHEFARVLGKNLRAENLREPQVLIVGSATALGAAIARSFAHKGAPFIAVRGINEIDFASPDARALFEDIPLRRAFVVYQPPLSRHARTDGAEELGAIAAEYVRGLTEFLNAREVPFVFAPVAPMSEEVLATALKNGGCVVEVPNLVDHLAFHDLENPMIRAVRECRISGRSFIEHAPGATVDSFTANEVSKFVRRQIKDENDLRKGRFAIHGNTNVTVEQAVRIAVDAAGFGTCNLSFAPYPHRIPKVSDTNHQAIVGASDANVTAMIAQSFRDFSRQEKDSPYFSIVVVGRHDNFSKGFEDRAQNFLDTIDCHLQSVPLADIEIVFVDYATPVSDTTLLHEVLRVGEHLKGRVRFVIVPPESHSHLLRRLNASISFPEYIAKNIGIRRSRGKFVLTTNPDDLLSLRLFEHIASREFNTALLYRAPRWDNRDTTFYPIPDLVRGLSEPWDMRTWDVNQRCHVSVHRFSVINSSEALDAKLFPCGAGDFILMSKKLWDSVEGFNEFPANPNVDMLFFGRMMKFVPGFVQMVMYPLILHQRHVKRNIYRPSIVNTSDLVSEYACTGGCTRCGQFAETVNWGLSDERFKEVVA
jgi:hypothetical protein